MSSDNPYSPVEQWLHRLALASDSRLELAFSLEKQVFGKRLPADTGNHLFVCGLARAGTTLLMRLLHETGGFCSLTYRDMPFVLSPNLWAVMSGQGKKSSAPRERAHGDGVLVDYDSPEALEEVFWRVFCGSDYIHPDHLSPMLAPDEVIDDFRTYVGLILQRYSGSRYVSKNNNNILRISAILEAFPEARILIPFRHPRSQARSLLEQHLLFSGKQQREPFIRRYMRWLVHCEFGLDHKPFAFGEARRPPFPLTDAGYWLSLWMETYGGLLDRHGNDPRIHFLCYEQLCSDPAAYWSGLAERLRLPAAPPPTLHIRPLRDEADGAAAVTEEAEAVYQSLLARSG